MGSDRLAAIRDAMDGARYQSHMGLGERGFGDYHLNAVMEAIRPEVLSLTAELAEANARADALFERRLPCREAEIAQARYEAAEALHPAETVSKRLDAENARLREALVSIAAEPYVFPRYIANAALHTATKGETE